MALFKAIQASNCCLNDDCDRIGRFFTVLLHLIVAAALKHVIIQEADIFSRHLSALRLGKKLFVDDEVHLYI